MRSCAVITIDSDHKKRSICERCTLFLHSPFPNCNRMVALTLINTQKAHMQICNQPVSIMLYSVMIRSSGIALPSFLQLLNYMKEGTL